MTCFHIAMPCCFNVAWEGAFATHDRQDTRSIFAALQHLVGLCRNGGNLLRSRPSVFHFLLVCLSSRAIAEERVRMKPFPDEMAEYSQGCYGRPPDEGEAYPYTHLPRDMVSRVIYYPILSIMCCTGEPSIYLTRGRLRGCKKHHKRYDEVL